MRNLSDEITFLMPITGLNTGYVNLYIYHNGVGIFSGRAYNNGTNPIEVNLNDMIMQNRGKYDYLKLANDGNVISNPMIIPTSYPNNRTKFINGLLNNYGVTIMDSASHYSHMEEDVLAVYDYPNKDLAPNAEYPEAPDTSLTRLMQGCYWIYNHDDEIGRFNNELLPHYPAVDTTKYGMGFQLLDVKGEDWSIRATYGADLSIGKLQGVAVRNTGMEFLSLHDLVSNVSVNEDEDTSIYLKIWQTNGNEFGDTIEEYTLYNGDVSILQMVECRREIGSADDWQERAINRSDESFTDAVRTYIELAQDGGLPESQYNNIDEWNANEIISNPATLVFHTSNRQSQYYAETAVENYTDFYFNNPIIYKTDDFFEYAYRPGFYADIYETEIPAKFIGTCPLAILDNCYSRYYLAWMDRYGDIQSQAFDGKVEYSENFDKTEIKDYKLRRRIIHNEMQPKWKLNTKWLNEDVYPMYESIFTSPYLLLYDTETDRSWNVILRDNDYTEKTFKNEKKLFNLDITVEANKKDNYLF